MRGLVDALAGVVHGVLAEAEDVLVLRASDGHALIEIELGHLQAEGAVALGQQRREPVAVGALSAPEHGLRRQRQGLGVERGEARRRIAFAAGIGGVRESCIIA